MQQQNVQYLKMGPKNVEKLIKTDFQVLGWGWGQKNKNVVHFERSWTPKSARFEKSRGVKNAWSGLM